MSPAVEIAALFHRDLTRLIQQVEAFPSLADLWAVERGISNPAGNLVLHLEGNLREYVGRGMADVPYERHRDGEFSNRDVPGGELIERIAAVRTLVVSAIEAFSEVDLEKQFPEEVLGVPLTHRQFLIHLHGHLNYHLGQIDYLRRVRTGQGAIDLAGLTRQA